MLGCVRGQVNEHKRTQTSHRDSTEAAIILSFGSPSSPTGGLKIVVFPDVWCLLQGIQILHSSVSYPALSSTCSPVVPHAFLRLIIPGIIRWSLSVRRFRKLARSSQSVVTYWVPPSKSKFSTSITLLPPRSFGAYNNQRSSGERLKPTYTFCLMVATIRVVWSAELKK